MRKLALVCLSVALFTRVAPATAEVLAIDVALSPAGSFKIVTDKVTGSAKKNTDGSVSAENVVIDMTSISTGIALRDKHTKERLETEKFTQAKLVKASGKDGKGTATIEVKGKKVDVTGTYKVEGSRLKADFPMKMSDLAIEKVRYMSVGAKDQVMVHMDLPIK